jgi:S1-C subfamily serine protease
MLLIDLEKAKPHRLIRQLALSLAVALLFELGGVSFGLADVTNSAALDSSTPPNLGSIGEYARETGAPQSAIASYVPLLGISVFSGNGRLATGQELGGLIVTSVDQSGVGYAGGIRGEHLQMGRASAQLGMIVVVVGAAAIFPPAMLGIPLLAKMPSPKISDVIVAIDAERIRDVSELGEYLHNAKAGETLYLTVIRDGRRVQLGVPIPTAASPHAPVLPK